MNNINFDKKTLKEIDLLKKENENFFDSEKTKNIATFLANTFIEKRIDSIDSTDFKNLPKLIEFIKEKDFKKFTDTLLSLNDFGIEKTIDIKNKYIIFGNLKITRLYFEDEITIISLIKI